MKEQKPTELEVNIDGSDALHSPRRICIFTDALKKHAQENERSLALVSHSFWDEVAVDSLIYPRSFCARWKVSKNGEDHFLGILFGMKIFRS